MQNDEFVRRLHQKKIIIATHVYGTGASQDLFRYVVEHKIKRALFIGHPLFYDPHLKGSGFELYERGKRLRQYYSKNRNIPLFAGFIVHAVKSFIWAVTNGPKWDLYIGSNNLNAYVGIVLKKIGLVSHVVYYVIDYNPSRFANPVINRWYHFLDRYCVLNCDETWNLSPRMEEGRKKYFNFSGGHQKLVPVGIWKQSMAHVPFAQIHTHTAVFLGHILKKQGVQYVISAIPAIKKHIGDFRLLVLGGGEYLDTLKRQVNDLHVGAHVTCTGFIADHAQIEDKLSRNALGIALYDKNNEGRLNFSYFSSPTKLKAYLAAGLPVLLTDVPYNAHEMEKEGCGKISTTDPADIAKQIISILSDQKELERMRTNVVRYRKQFDWEVIFAKALETLI